MVGQDIWKRTTTKPLLGSSHHGVQDELQEPLTVVLGRLARYILATSQLTFEEGLSPFAHSIQCEDVHNAHINSPRCVLYNDHWHDLILHLVQRVTIVDA